MARQRKSSFADDVISLVALMPWWVGVVLAVVVFAALHFYATVPIEVLVIEPGKPLPIDRAVLGGLMRGLAYAGQFIGPALCLAGAAVSAWKRRQSRELVLRATDASAVSAVAGMSWREFERLVAEAFRMRGYHATETGGAGPDGGVDLVLSKGQEKFLVQCKHWRARQVGVEVIRQLYGVMAAEGATGGFVVTSGRFSAEALGFADGRNIELIDGSGLKGLLADGLHTTQKQQAQSQASAASTVLPPRCPQCDVSMVKRVAQKGAASGREFWGCGGYPKCRGTRPA